VCALSRSLGPQKSPTLCYVTDRHSLPSAPTDPFAAIAQKMEIIASAGIDWVQIREKDLCARDLAALTRQSLRYAAAVLAGRSAGPRILVNDRLDVAVAERAGGVHLGESSLPVVEAKRLVEARASGADFLVGVSCHSVDAAKVAAGEGADYVFFGPVFATPSKAVFGAPQGIQRLAEVCRSVSVPVLAIGGITLGNAPACLAAGVAGIAAIRLFQDATDPGATVRALRQLSG
jgi:thiamine-phosphate pyrophosphorylase